MKDVILFIILSIIIISTLIIRGLMKMNGKNKPIEENNIPNVNFRFGDIWRVTDFIQHDNDQIIRVAKTLIDENSTPEGRLHGLNRYIGYNFRYPFNSQGQPAAEAVLNRFKFQVGNWLWHDERVYTWLFPVETDVCGWGICIDTANLYASIVRAMGMKCYVCLGSVHKTEDDSLLGYHAWAWPITKINGNEVIAETTIHGTDKLFIPADKIYNRKMDVYYTLDAYYDEGEYFELKGNVLNPFDKHKAYYEEMKKEGRVKGRAGGKKRINDKIFHIWDAIRKENGNDNE